MSSCRVSTFVKVKCPAPRPPRIDRDSVRGDHRVFAPALKKVFGGAWHRIALLPELFDELRAIFIGSQFLERDALLVTDEVDYVLIRPFELRRCFGTL